MADIKISETARYLAQYIKDNEHLVLVYSQREDCDFIDRQELEKVVQAFYDDLE